LSIRDLSNLRVVSLDTHRRSALTVGHNLKILRVSSILPMTNMSLRTLLAAFLLVAVANAFAPASRPAFASKTALQFGFLKELGIEKPDWLPDFGGKKEEAPAPAEEEAPAPAAEEEAPAEAAEE
jgi:hypothetical protein